jgi:hypothetical protein
MGNGSGLGASDAVCVFCCDMWTDDGGVISGFGAVVSMKGRPFACECMGRHGGEVGVFGWTSGFVWSLVLAASW